MWQGLAPLITRTLGETAAHPGRGENVLLRRAGSLEDVSNDETPRQLEVAVAAIAGATALTLRLLTGGKIKGTLPQGARLTLAGQTYTTAAAVVSPVGATTLAVVLSAGLAAPAASDALVDLQPDAVFTLENCHVSRRMRRDLSRDLHADHMAVITVPSQGATVTPRLNDSLELEDGTVGRVAAVPITTGAFWKLQMGGA
jgi:hypothetical protein